MKPVGYGIDFGTSNSAIAIAYPDRVDVVPVEPLGLLPSMLPSLLYLHRDGTRLTGTDAAETYGLTGMARHLCRLCPLVEGWTGDQPDTSCRSAVRDGGSNDARLLAGLKYDLADPRSVGTHSWAVDFEIEDQLCYVLRRLKRAADRTCGEDVRRVYLGRPVEFPGTAAGGDDDLAEARLRRAAERAGFTEVRFLLEPVAASLVEPEADGNLLMLDFGGGTFDVLAWPADEDADSGISGRDIGGQNLDRALFAAKFEPTLGLDVTQRGQSGAEMRMPALWKRGFSGFSMLRRLMAEEDFGNWLRSGMKGPNAAAYAAMNALVNGGAAHEFYRAIEQAKIALTDVESTRVRLERDGLKVDVQVDRSDLDAIFAQYRAQIDLCIDEALEKAGLEEGQIDTVVTTGGSSRLAPFVKHVQNRFGSERVKARDPFSMVVRGLGEEARNEWGETAPPG